MKKWILAALAVLLVWNVILTYSIASNSSRQKESSGIAENVVTDYTTDLSEMADQVRSSVVSISARVNGVRHTVSGIVYAKEENTVYVFTTDQILSDDSDLTITFDSGTAVSAEAVASDPETASAVLKAEVPFDVTAVKTGSSDVLRQGEYVLAMGGRTVSTGAAPVSFGITGEPGQRRLLTGSSWFASAVETDTAVTSEMLGGPLFNIGGELVGMLVTKAGYGSERMSYALAVNEMKILYEQIKTEGAVSRGSAGVVVRSVSDMRAYEKSERNISLSQAEGVLVTYVAENSASENILMADDVLISFNGLEIEDTAGFRSMLYGAQSGEEVTFTILRNGEQMEVSVTLQ